MSYLRFPLCTWCVSGLRFCGTNNCKWDHKHDIVVILQDSAFAKVNNFVCNVKSGTCHCQPQALQTPPNTDKLKTMFLKKQLIGEPAAVLSCVKFCWTRGGKNSDSRACLASARSCCRAAPAVCPSFPRIVREASVRLAYGWRTTSGDIDNQGSARTKAMWLQSLCRDPNKQLQAKFTSLDTSLAAA